MSALVARNPPPQHVTVTLYICQQYPAIPMVKYLTTGRLDTHVYQKYVLYIGILPHVYVIITLFLLDLLHA